MNDFISGEVCLECWGCVCVGVTLALWMIIRLLKKRKFLKLNDIEKKLVGMGYSEQKIISNKKKRLRIEKRYGKRDIDGYLRVSYINYLEDMKNMVNQEIPAIRESFATCRHTYDFKRFPFRWIRVKKRYHGSRRGEIEISWFRIKKQDDI